MKGNKRRHWRPYSSLTGRRLSLTRLKNGRLSRIAAPNPFKIAPLRIDVHRPWQAMNVRRHGYR